MSKLNEFKLDDKYLVIKREDIIELLENSPLNAAQMRVAITKINNARRNKGKKENEYLVVNVDEPYAYKVAALIKGQEIIRPIKIMCKDVLYGFDDLMTKGKVYESNKVENGEYWIEDDQGQYNPFPQECFEVVSI